MGEKENREKGTRLGKPSKFTSPGKIFSHATAKNIHALIHKLVSHSRDFIHRSPAGTLPWSPVGTSVRQTYFTPLLIVT